MNLIGDELVCEERNGAKNRPKGRKGYERGEVQGKRGESRGGEEEEEEEEDESVLGKCVWRERTARGTEESWVLCGGARRLWRTSGEGEK